MKQRTRCSVCIVDNCECAYLFLLQMIDDRFVRAYPVFGRALSSSHLFFNAVSVAVAAVLFIIWISGQGKLFGSV